MTLPFLETLPGVDGLTWHAFIHDEYVTRCLRDTGTYSPAELALCRQYLTPGAHVVVVGANIGAVAIPLAQTVYPGTVVAFEPQRLMYMTLCANAVINGLETVLAVNAACGAEHGSARVPSLDPRFPANFGGVPVGRGPALVEVQTLDMLALPGCALLHIDVEGMEPDVLRGAAATIARCQPVIYAEVDRPEVECVTLELLRGMGYTRMWLHKPPLIGHYVSYNVLALPDGADEPVDDGHLTALP
jgi:FkbM family methyltransferase